MKELKKYLPLSLLMFFYLLIIEPNNHFQSYSWLRLVVLFIGIILLFEFLELSRAKRIQRWKDNRPSKIMQVLKFSILLGLPISAIIIFLIRNKAELFYSIIFIAIPLIVIFGWIGLMDWQNCNKENLQEKYKVTLPK
jgi:hypothetical protein